MGRAEVLVRCLAKRSLDRITYSRYSTELTVPVPDITVPDVITVTSQILSSTPIALGRLNAALPTAGSFDNFWLQNDFGEWAPEPQPRFPRFAVQVEVVPEPPTIALLVIGLLEIAWIASIRNSWTIRVIRGSVMIIGDRLRALREEKKLSQGDIESVVAYFVATFRGSRMAILFPQLKPWRSLHAHWKFPCTSFSTTVMSGPSCRFSEAEVVR